MSAHQKLLDAITPILEPGEQLIEAVIGHIGEDVFDSVVALTSRRLRIASPTGGPSIEFSNLKRVSWAGLWARLNIDVKQPSRRIAVAVYGSHWKQKAKALAAAAEPLIKAAAK